MPPAPRSNGSPSGQSAWQVAEAWQKAQDLARQLPAGIAKTSQGYRLNVCMRNLDGMCDRVNSPKCAVGLICHLQVARLVCATTFLHVIADLPSNVE